MGHRVRRSRRSHRHSRPTASPQPCHHDSRRQLSTEGKTAQRSPTKGRCGRTQRREKGASELRKISETQKKGVTQYQPSSKKRTSELPTGLFPEPASNFVRKSSIASRSLATALSRRACSRLALPQ